MLLSFCVFAKQKNVFAFLDTGLLRIFSGAVEILGETLERAAAIIRKLADNNL